jgi:hypothetical protein
MARAATVKVDTAKVAKVDTAKAVAGAKAACRVVAVTNPAALSRAAATDTADSRAATARERVAGANREDTAPVQKDTVPVAMEWAGLRGLVSKVGMAALRAIMARAAAAKVPIGSRNA